MAAVTFPYAEGSSSSSRVGTGSGSGSLGRKASSSRSDFTIPREHTSPTGLTPRLRLDARISVSTAASVPPPPLKPQHCSFVMLAEFDIDRGSTLAHVWPDRSAIRGHDDQ